MDPINPEWMDNVRAKIASITDCTELDRYKNEILAVLNEMQAEITAAIMALIPVVSIPSIDEIISWVTSFIMSYLQKPYLDYVALQAELIAFIAEVTALLDSLNLNLNGGVGCGLTIPTPPVPPVIPPLP